MSNVQKIEVPVASKHIAGRLMDFYSEFSVDSIPQVDELYTQDAEFIDPVHKLTGSLALKSYLKRMAINMTSYEMRYIEKIQEEGCAHLTWEMTFSHKNLKGGKPITVRGMSVIRYTTKVYYHEDCYDLGALLYEHLPLLGGITRFLKNRLR